MDDGAPRHPGTPCLEWQGHNISRSIEGSEFHFARLTLSHPPNMSVFLPRFLRPLHSPVLARSSPVPRPAPPSHARPSPGPHFKQSSRQNGQKRNLLIEGGGPLPEHTMPAKQTRGMDATKTAAKSASCRARAASYRTKPCRHRRQAMSAEQQHTEHQNTETTQLRDVPEMVIAYRCSSSRRRLTKGWFSKRVGLAYVRPPGTKTGTTVYSDIPPERKPEGGYVPRNENRNEGTFAKTTLLRNRPFVFQRSHKI